RDAIEAAVAPELRTADWPRPSAVLKLLTNHLEPLIETAIAGAEGIVISVSHDFYLGSTGGVQLFIGDEQAAFARRRLTYLNLSPTEPDLVFAADGAPGMVRLVLDGESIGILLRRPRGDIRPHPAAPRRNAHLHRPLPARPPYRRVDRPAGRLRHPGELLLAA
ncbi:MAG: hypothetical protein NT133_07530, partial [Alphaproteobacteria bacterium]|nr:hypothetical protein [Alphaproteobacteria bacterium]